MLDSVHPVGTVSENLLKWSWWVTSNTLHWPSFRVKGGRGPEPLAEVNGKPLPPAGAGAAAPAARAAQARASVSHFLPRSRARMMRLLSEEPIVTLLVFGSAPIRKVTDGLPHTGELPAAPPLAVPAPVRFRCCSEAAAPFGNGRMREIRSSTPSRSRKSEES